MEQLNKICKNPECGKEFIDTSYNKKKKFCSSGCLEAYYSKNESPKDIESYQRGSINLPCGVQIRNDAVGKEISGDKGYISRKRSA